MRQQDINQFQAKVKSILEWSTVDPVTREVLRLLMQEVVDLVQSAK